MINNQTYFPEKFLLDQAEGGPLSTLKPLAQENASAVVDQNEGISTKYINFLRRIGVGETKNGMFIYEPYRAIELVNHPSYRIYNSPPSRRLFGLMPAKSLIPPELVCVADSGASWRYCLDLRKSDEVFCFDMCGSEITSECRDFFSFIESHVLDVQ